MSFTPFATPILAIIGPTCSGKSRLAARLAEQAPVAIVNVDSALVYRGLDIGTAKPGLSERQSLPHYMIDCVNPDQSYSVWQFRAELLDRLARIHQRELCPVLVGGSMFYFLALMTGMPGASSDPHCQAQARTLIEERGTEAIYKRLQKSHPRLLDRVHPNDHYRIQKALEKSLSSNRPEQKSDPLPLSTYFLAPPERDSLSEPIRDRFQSFLDNGLVEEVRALREEWGLTARHPSMRLVAYRQVYQYLDGSIDRKEMENRAYLQTRGLCKRQYTWMRSGRLGDRWNHDAARLEICLLREIEGYSSAG